MRRSVSIGILLAGVAIFALASGQPGASLADHESKAVGTIRSINTAQVSYAKTYSSAGFACSLAPLLVGPAGAKPSAEHAGLLDNSLREERNRMYRFTVECMDKSKPSKAYRSSAVPLEKGARAFCSDQTAVVKSSADGKAETCFAKGTALK